MIPFYRDLDRMLAMADDDGIKILNDALQAAGGAMDRYPRFDSAYLTELKSRLREIPNHKYNYFGSGDEAIHVIEKLMEDNEALRERLKAVEDYGTEEINAAVRLRNEIVSIRTNYESALKRCASLEARLEGIKALIEGKK